MALRRKIHLDQKYKLAMVESNLFKVHKEKKVKTILHLCADIGSDSQPYRDADYNVILVGSAIGVENYHPPKDVYGIIANPPCTMFSIARTVAKSPRDLREGMRLVKECLRIIWECQYDLGEGTRKSNLAFWVIENPATGILKYFLGNPAYQYCPSEFGAPFTKRTALWGYFNPPKKPFFLMNPLKNKSLASGRGEFGNPIFKYKGTFEEKREAQMHDRSRVYEPFARAFFEVNQ